MTSKRSASFSMTGSMTGAPLAPCRKMSGMPLPTQRESVRQPMSWTVWSVNGMVHAAAGDTGFGDDRRDLGKVHRRHDMSAGDAGNVGQPVQHLDADLAPLELGVGRALEALDERVGDDRAEELVAHPARRFR